MVLGLIFFPGAENNLSKHSEDLSNARYYEQLWLLRGIRTVRSGCALHAFFRKRFQVNQLIPGIARDLRIEHGEMADRFRAGPGFRRHPLAMDSKAGPRTSSGRHQHRKKRFRLLLSDHDESPRLDTAFPDFLVFQEIAFLFRMESPETANRASPISTPSRSFFE